MSKSILKLTRIAGTRPTDLTTTAAMHNEARADRHERLWQMATEDFGNDGVVRCKTTEGERIVPVFYGTGV